MWGLNTELPKCDRLRAQALKHYEETTSAIDHTLEQYISKHNLVLVMLGVYLTLRYVVPWIRKHIWGMTIATLILKLFLVIPITRPLVKKLMREGYGKIYNELDHMLYGERRPVIHESIPEVKVQAQTMKERVEVSNLDGLNLFV